MLSKKEKKYEIDFEFDPRYRPAFLAGRAIGIEDGIRLLKEDFVGIINRIKEILKKCENGEHKEPYLNEIAVCVGTEIRFATLHGDYNDETAKIESNQKKWKKAKI